MSKILITTSSFAKYDSRPLELCNKKKLQIVCNPYGRKVTFDELIDLGKDAVGLIAGTESLTDKVFSKLTMLRVISRCGVGLDNVDLHAAKKFGIKVFNTPDGPTLSVAELTVGLILNLLRKTNVMDSLLRKGEWKKLMGNLLYNKNVGLIGFGRIGRKLFELLKPFGCNICFCDPFVADGTLGLKRLLIDELLKWADIVSLHVSTTDMLLGRKEIELMKQGAWLVNVSRGGVVDEEAVFDFLKERKLSGAAFDVFEQEPYSGLLRDIDNVILTPHIGSYAKEARIKMEIEAVENLLSGLEDVWDKR